MLHCAVKFCGGCNPMYDRGDAYRNIAETLAGVADFSLPRDGEAYDVLLILRGCTGCPYLYEDISATHRIVCASQSEADHAAERIAALCTH